MLIVWGFIWARHDAGAVPRLRSTHEGSVGIRACRWNARWTNVNHCTVARGCLRCLELWT